MPSTKNALAKKCNATSTSEDIVKLSQNDIELIMITHCHRPQTFPVHI